ncbi:Tryptophan synthase [Phytophthora nicotianae]|uniref:Tryptophan synthase n=1 Tax=Phytophthora nicotianae TaxID=4792 RepID=A0A0W8CPQ4_PHYNI|nr:Tryptophan synthase [Phytophthora nicotianae]
MAKHRKVCGKKKAPKTRKVINRESYKRHKDKILNKCFKQRVFNRFRRLEANFQAKQEKAQALRDEELAKLKKVIEEFESKGPCATYDEFKESNVQPVQE